MKKIILGALTAAGFFVFTNSYAQPVSDHAVVPVAVSLNQVLRIHVIEGGNIEFVFNTIDQYRDGIDNTEATAGGIDQFYNTQFTIASSTEWELDFGAESSVMFGTDNPANSIALNNVGYAMSEMGTASCCVAASDIDASVSNAVGSGAGAGTPNGLAQFNVIGPLMTSGVAENAGDVTENLFFIHWECGTTAAGGTTLMNTVTLLNQSLPPDRYVTNVFLDVNSIP